MRGTVTMMQITEDTPPDMLAGAMDLSVHLPNNIAVKMSVERSTPMMDLLVQITTSNHLQLSNYTLQALGWAPSSEHSDKILPFKPNTPIGALDTQHIRVIPKEKSLPPLKYKAPGHQPFESTFRLKVHLPRNQLYVTRVSRNVLLEDIMKKVCEEKNLDPSKYEFKRPGNLDEALNPKLTLSDYQITEIYVVSKGTTNLNQAFSSADIMVLRKEEERKQMHNKTGGGVFNLIFKRGKSSMGSGSVSSDNRSVSPTHSDDSRSVTPPTVQAPPIVPPPTKDPPPDKPKPPQRKRRPAPKPPQIQIAEPSNEEDVEKASSVVSNEAMSKPSSRKTSENGLTICHSRNSSDSSGYHEASILSDHCANASLPRNRPQSAFISDPTAHQSTSNLTKMAMHSKSTTSLITGRKKKAAPPPPPPTISPENSVVPQSEKPSPLVASQPDISTHKESLDSSNLTVENSIDCIPPCTVETSTPIRTISAQGEKTLDSTDSGIAQETHLEKDIKEPFGFHTPPPPPILVDLKPLDENLESNTTQLEQKPENFIVSECLPNCLIENNNNTESEINDIKPINSQSPNLIKSSEPETELVDIDWQYQLPSPPKAFRDSSPVNVNAKEENSVSDFKDSVVTSPELFEKLNTLEDNNSEKDTLKSDLISVASEEPLNTLSLEHLEKRKSLVYNRELATSLKMTDSLENSSNPTDTFVSSPPKHQASYNGSGTSDKSYSQPPKPVRTTSHHTLPNFKITTYDVPKQNIKVFEDDTIRSNTQSAFNLTNLVSKEPETFNKISSINNMNREKDKEYKFYRPQSTTRTLVARSGSFSTDDRSFKPVSRSKSTLTLNKYPIGKSNENNISRSNSLFDVSGLHSLEVMKLIQNKLSTPTSSLENLNAPNKLQSIPHQIHEPEIPKVIHQDQIEEKSEPQSPKPVKKYYYRGPPPAVNMSTWSERPKVPVAVKEDEDYKLGNANVSSKLIVTTNNNNVISNNSLKIKNNLLPKNEVNTTKNNSVHVNGTDQITQSSGNVIIKIGGTQSTIYHKNFETERYLGPVGYKKTFHTSVPRPHSIALPSDFDISRVPVVKSVELKKPFRDIHESNTSITHINHSNDGFNSLHHNLEKKENYMGKFRSIENLYGGEPNRRLININSFKPVDDDYTAPVVKGSKQDGQRSSWTNFTYNTLPAKPKVDKDYTTNQHVPFSQATLRRTNSRKIFAAGLADKDVTDSPQTENNLYSSLPPAATQVKVQNKSTLPPPPPPQMPTVSLRQVKPLQIKTSESPTDARDMLLESIRNFGGKKGLRTSKA